MPDEHPHTADLVDEPPDQRSAPRSGCGGSLTEAPLSGHPSPSSPVTTLQLLSPADDRHARPSGAHPATRSWVARRLRDEAQDLREVAGMPGDSPGYWHTLTGLAERLDDSAALLEG